MLTCTTVTKINCQTCRGSHTSNSCGDLLLILEQCHHTARVLTNSLTNEYVFSKPLAVFCLNHLLATTRCPVSLITPALGLSLNAFLYCYG